MFLEPEGGSQNASLVVILVVVVVVAAAVVVISSLKMPKGLFPLRLRCASLRCDSH